MRKFARHTRDIPIVWIDDTYWKVKILFSRCWTCTECQAVELCPDHASRTYALLRHGCSSFTLSPDLHRQQKNEIQYLVGASLDFPGLLEWHSDRHLLWHSTNWTILGCCCYDRNLRELDYFRPGSRRLVSRLSSLHIHPSDPDCFKATNFPETAIVHPWCFCDCHLVRF